MTLLEILFAIALIPMLIVLYVTVRRKPKCDSGHTFRLTEEEYKCERCNVVRHLRVIQGGKKAANDFRF